MELHFLLPFYSSHFIFNFVLITGKFGVVYKGFYTSKENKAIEVAIKTVKSMYNFLRI